MKVKRQKILPGSILEIHANSLYFYAQILHTKDCAFFDFQSTDPIEDISKLVTKNVLFILRVYEDVITKGRWKKIGKLEVREDLIIVPYKFIQDPLNPDNIKLYNPNTGEIIPSNKQKAKGLECASVWEAEHVEDRLRDHFEGRSNIWEEQLTLK